MTGVPNPWLIVGAIMAFIGAFLAGNWHGHDAENKSWEVSMGQKKVDAAKKLVDLTNTTRAQESKIADLTHTVESKDAELRKTMANADQRFADYIAAHGGLRDPKGRGGSCGGATPQTVSPTGSGHEAAAGCELSTETSTALRVLARDADDVTNTLRACQTYVSGLSPVINAP